MPSSSGRSKRGELPSAYHAGTPIPPFPEGSSKPKAPRRESQHKKNKFTAEDKVFFIQFLRWRLCRPGAIPSRQELYEALEKEVRTRSTRCDWYAEEVEILGTSPQRGCMEATLG